MKQINIHGIYEFWGELPCHISLNVSDQIGPSAKDQIWNQVSDPIALELREHVFEQIRIYFINLLPIY